MYKESVYRADWQHDVNLQKSSFVDCLFFVTAR